MIVAFGERIVIIKCLYKIAWLLFPWPKPETSSSDECGTGGGVDEDAYARGVAGVDDVPGALYVHLGGQRDQPFDTFKEPDIGCRMNDRNFRVHAAVPAGGMTGWPWSRKGSIDCFCVRDVHYPKVDVGSLACGKIFARRGADIEDTNSLRVFASFEEMHDDPSSEKACLSLMH